MAFSFPFTLDFIRGINTILTVDIEDMNALLPSGKTRMSIAAEKGDVNSVENIMTLGGSMNVSNSDGTKPIHVAAIYGHSSVTGYLLRKGMDVDCYDLRNHTPLHYAAMRGYLDIVKLLVRSGADFNCDGPKNMKPMHYAAINGHLEVVRYLLDVEAEFDARNSDGHTPLLLAAVHANRGVVNFLVVCGADVDCYVIDRWRVLHHASLNGWTEIVKHLVNRGAQLDNKTVCGQTALLLATRNFHEDIVKLLIEAGANLKCDNDKDKWNVLHHASYLGWVDIVCLLINSSIDLNTETSRGETAVLLAAKMGMADVVEMLLHAGASFDYCKTDQNWNLMHFASAKGWVELVKYLFQTGCDIEAKTREGETPLAIACSKGHVETVNYLLKVGADTGAKSTKGSLPFSDFVHNFRSIEAIRVFVESGAYLNFEQYCMLNMRGNSMLKQGLQDTNICIQSILNKFNNKDLPDLYELPISAYLPSIDRLRIGKNQQAAEDIKRCVENEMHMKSICNIDKINPMVLSMMCVKTLIESSNTKPENKLKRSAPHVSNEKIKIQRLN